MNEQEMADLLDRATRDLAPDIDELVAGGLRRGRARRRRRRATPAVTAVVAAVAAVMVAGSQLSGSTGVGGRGPDAADPVPSSISRPSPTASTRPPARHAKARLGVTTDQVPATFASLEPGRVSAPSARSGPDAAPVVDFTWNGLGIRVGITPDDYVTGRSVPDPARRCAEQAQGKACRAGSGGSVVSTSASTNPAVDGGTEVRSVWVFRPDGWDVLVMAYNGPTKQGPPTADKPPFTLSQLRGIAASDVWFR